MCSSSARAPIVRSATRPRRMGQGPQRSRTCRVRSAISVPTQMSGESRAARRRLGQQRISNGRSAMARGIRALKRNTWKSATRVLRGLRGSIAARFSKCSPRRCRSRGGEGPGAAAFVPAGRRRQCRDRQERRRRAGWRGSAPFTFAYISDTHLYQRTLNQRFVRARGQSRRGRQRARPAARLRAVRRRSCPARTPRGTRPRQADPRRGQGAG